MNICFCRKQSQIALLEQEAKVLRQRILTMESDNQRLLNESKILQAQQNTKKLGQSSPKLVHGVDVSKLQQKIDQMDADIHRFIKRINELEKEKETLSTELELRIGMDSNSAAISIDKSADLSKQNEFLSSSLKSEQQKLKLAEQQLNDYRAVIAQSENQKLITMATRVEILVNQLKSVNERYDALHRKLSAGAEKKNYEVFFLALKCVYLNSNLIFVIKIIGCFARACGGVGERTGL